nr:MCP four helix bundle domain-containing protein [Bacteroidota bacterium]
MKVENVKISTVLYALVFLIAIIMGVTAVLTIRSLGEINQGTKTMFDDRVVPLQRLKIVSDRLVIDIVNTTYDMNHNTLEWGKGSRFIEEALADIRINWDAYLAIESEGQELDLRDDAMVLQKNAVKAVEDLLKIAVEKNESSAAQLDYFIGNHLYINIDPFIEQIKKLMNIQLTLAHRVYDESEATYQRSFIILIISFSLGIFIMLLASLHIIKTVSRSLGYANSVIDKVANGNLNVKITRVGKDEIGVLLGNIRNMLDKFRDVISFITESAGNVAQASHHLNIAARQISQGASEQASAIEEISASVEEMSSNIQQNLHNAKKSEQISSKAAAEISKVEQSSSESLEKIKEIAQKITVIGSISFQTHILALNAAIEAARAGIHGRGFGVVASEVGKLADRSKTAATEIDQLAQNSVSTTENAVKSMKAIVPDIISTSRFVQEITAANNEQSIGTDQINNGVQQLNQVTQHNAASAEELSSSANILAKQADELMSMISFFEVDTVSVSRQLPDLLN